MIESRLGKLETLLLTKGVRAYGLDGVSQLQHALQAATSAEREQAGDALIAAALLHDVGHMVHDLGDNPAAVGIDDRHEAVGHAWLTRWFGPAVTEPVRMHVAAKRFLCATEADYAARLSADSVRSLALQGGPMSAEEVAVFRATPHSDAAVRLRRWDEAAKDPDAKTPDVAHFLPYVGRALRPG